MISSIYSIARGDDDSYLSVTDMNDNPTGVIVRFWVDGEYRNVIQTMTFSGTSDDIYPIVIGKDIPQPMRDKVMSKMSDYLMRIDNVIFADNQDVGAQIASSKYSGDVRDGEDETIVGGLKQTDDVDEDGGIEPNGLPNGVPVMANTTDNLDGGITDTDIDGDVQGDAVDDTTAVQLNRESKDSLSAIFWKDRSSSLSDMISESYKINSDAMQRRGAYVTEATLGGYDVHINGNVRHICEQTANRVFNMKPNKNINDLDYLLVVCGVCR